MAGSLAANTTGANQPKPSVLCAADAGDRRLGGSLKRIPSAFDDRTQGVGAIVASEAELIEPRLTGALRSFDGIAGAVLDATGDGAKQLAFLARGREQGSQHRARCQATRQRQQRRFLDAAGGLAAGAVIRLDRSRPRWLVSRTAGLLRNHYSSSKNLLRRRRLSRRSRLRGRFCRRLGRVFLL